MIKALLERIILKHINDYNDFNPQIDTIAKGLLIYQYNHEMQKYYLKENYIISQKRSKIKAKILFWEKLYKNLYHCSVYDSVLFREYIGA